MNLSLKNINNKKVFSFAAIACLVLMVGILIFIARNVEKPEPSSIAPPHEGKSMNELEKDFSTPVNPGIESVRISNGFVESLSVPLKTGSADTSGKDADILQPQTSNVSSDILINLSQPSK